MKAGKVQRVATRLIAEAGKLYEDAGKLARREVERKEEKQRLRRLRKQKIEVFVWFDDKGPAYQKHLCADYTIVEDSGDFVRLLLRNRKGELFKTISRVRRYEITNLKAEKKNWQDGA